MRLFMRALLIAFIAFVIAVPFILSAYPETLAAEALILGLFAMSIDVLAGVAGRVPLGHAAMFGTGAYVVAYHIAVSGGNAWIGMLLGLATSAAVAALFGALAVRTTGVYFLLLTLAEGMIVWGICFRWTSVTGAETGIRGVARPALIANPHTFYYFVLLTVTIAGLLIWRLVHSPFGQALRGISESTSRMRTLGYNVPLTLTIAFTLSGVFAGLAGILYVLLNNFVSPTDVSLDQSTQGLLMVILGGPGTLWGAFVGSAVIIALSNLVSAYTERWATILGLMFILTMLFASEGLIGRARALLVARGTGRKPA